MDAVDPSMSWENFLPISTKSVVDFVRWAIVCPKPIKKKLETAYFFSTDAVNNESSENQLLGDDFASLAITYLTAFLMLYVLDLLAQVFYAVGCSFRSNEPANTPPTSSASTVSLKKKPSFRRVAMNQPVDCVIRRSNTSIAADKNNNNKK